MTLTTFASLVHSEARALASIETTAEEGALIPTNPAVFIPTCSKHETFTDTPNTFLVTIDAGMQVQLMDVVTNWFLGTGPTSVVANTPAENYCPP